MRIILIACRLMTIFLLIGGTAVGQELFPDGTPIPEWFRQTAATDIDKLGEQYKIVDHGVILDSTKIQTEQIQAVIDKAYKNGGGVVIVPKGTFLTGSLFFKRGTHLHLDEGAVLKGSDDISHFALIETRIEGQTVKYFAAMVNADKVDGFTVSGKGTLNGNGHRYWRAFWLRREFNPQCTNMDEMRPRVLYVSNSKDVQISGIRLINSPFWTSHFYKCENLKLLDLYIYAPHLEEKAPSSDAVDLDACKNVLIKNCYMSVNDDAIALKGGKGPFADKDDNNGGNYNILIEDCEFGFCHSTLTFGSESIYDRNIVLRRAKVQDAKCLLRFKMRPDTPQHYEYVLVEDIEGSAANVFLVNPWTQFFNLKGEEKMRTGRGNNVTLRNIKLKTDVIFNVVESDQYKLSDIKFENLQITTNREQKVPKGFTDDFKLKNVVVNNKKLKH